MNTTCDSCDTTKRSADPVAAAAPVGESVVPCPFCGSSNVRIAFDGYGRCRQCGADALHWNTRAYRSFLTERPVVAWVYFHDESLRSIAVLDRDVGTFDDDNGHWTVVTALVAA